VNALRWLAGSLLPAALALLLLYKSDKRREPPWLVGLTYTLGFGAAVATFLLERRIGAWTGLEMHATEHGTPGSLLLVFAVVAPLREAAKVAAMWPAFRSKHFDEPYDGVVYAGASGLGFATFENAWLLAHAHPAGVFVWVQVLLALPAHLFFAALWGYALGRARQAKIPGAIFPASWLVAVAAHGLYLHLLYGRGSGALVALVPLLLAMTGVALVAARDLRRRGDRPSRIPTLGGMVNRLSRTSLSGPLGPPSLRGMERALRRSDGPIALRWVAIGTLVTVGAMVAGFGAVLAFGLRMGIDFSTVDEHDIATTGPAALLAAGILLAFPVSGFLVARASGLRTLLEPALASALAIAISLLALGLAAPLAFVFALAFSPVAWGLACAGAWVGRSEHPVYAGGAGDDGDDGGDGSGETGQVGA
jgi:RsiW-degrading membrane proteinase PrsW (M82 family)